MAASLTDRAERRAARVQAVIRGFLDEANPHAAFNASVGALQAEAARVRDRRPADAALIDAELAASLARLAAQLHAHKPRRPDGCPKVPGPDQMLATFNAVYGSGEQ